MTKGERASRLDPVQHRALHGLNAATKLTLKLSEKEALAVQRTALTHASAGVLTIEETARALGISGVRGSSTNGGSRDVQDALACISASGASAAARMLAFARVAWLKEEVLIVDLGARTRERQVKALHRRLGLNESDVRESNLPIHATHLHACCECRRVANAFATDDGKPAASTFNELGVSSAMLCTECDGAAAGSTHIRCAKRSSAAMRTALLFEEQAQERQIEANEIDTVAVETLLGFGTAASADFGTVAARIRRDAKNAHKQTAVALKCGDEAMMNFSLVGRAARVWNVWYSMCELCGAILQLSSHSRFGSELCCKKCDSSMLGMPPPAAPERVADTCRYCGKDDRANQGRWRVVKAPLDTAGANQNLPPPLRTCSYCPSHWRAWLQAAHRVLPTRIILSHIAHNAKPVFNADKVRSAHELGFEPVAKGKKRMRGDCSADP